MAGQGRVGAIVTVVAFGLVAIGCQVFRPTVTTPIGSPLTAAMCQGWPVSPPLAFADWTTFEELGFEALDEPRRSERVFALVTRDAIDQIGFGDGGSVHGRGLCVLHQDGSVYVSTVPDDWMPAHVR